MKINEVKAGDVWVDLEDSNRPLWKVTRVSNKKNVTRLEIQYPDGRTSFREFGDPYMQIANLVPGAGLL